VASFADADSALLAAREMRERVRALPPMSGIKLVLRAGVVLESEGGGEGRPKSWRPAWSKAATPTPLPYPRAEILSPSMRRMLGKTDDRAPPLSGARTGRGAAAEPGRVAPGRGQAPKQMRVSFRGRTG
jgi:hypothetical protein